VFASWLLIAMSTARAACEDTDLDPWDTAVDPAADCDGDGVTPGEGDCDDADPDIGPGRTEICGDRIDNDCDGLFDGGCDDPAARGSLAGGASCGAGAGGTVAAFVLPFLLWVRRRRR